MWRLRGSQRPKVVRRSACWTFSPGGRKVQSGRKGCALAAVLKKPGVAAKQASVAVGHCSTDYSKRSLGLTISATQWEVSDVPARSSRQSRRGLVDIRSNAERLRGAEPGRATL